jgi:hypothetical protein
MITTIALRSNAALKLLNEFIDVGVHEGKFSEGECED